MKDLTVVEVSITSDYHRAILKTVSSPHSGDWLHISACGLRLNDEAVRIATGLRFGIDLCAPHECPCGAIVLEDGSHGMSCSLGPGRTARHASPKDIIYGVAYNQGWVPSYKGTYWTCQV